MTDDTARPAGTGTGTDATASGTPASVLRNAADYLWQHGWTREQFYDRGSEEAFPPACAVGAIRLVVFGQPMDLVYDHDNPHVDPDVLAMADQVDEAQHALCAYLRVDYVREDCAPLDTISVWNDEPGRTLGDVMHTLHLAADRWEDAHTRSASSVIITDPGDLNPGEVLRRAGGYLFTFGYTTKEFYDRDVIAKFPPADVIGAIRAVVNREPIGGLLSYYYAARESLPDGAREYHAVEEAQHALCAHIKPDYERGSFFPIDVIWNWCEEIGHDLARIITALSDAADSADQAHAYASSYVEALLGSADGR
jgi:hypothetical protein